MSHWPLLSLVTFLPLVGVFFIMTARGDHETVARNAKNIALSTSLIVFILSTLLWIDFDPGSAAFQFVEKASWIRFGGFTINYHMGIDGISLFFVLLSTLLTVLCVLSSWQSVHSQIREYMIAFLVLETLMVGMFCALDFVLFYVFFEGVLIPMFLIIGIWGGPRRVYAAFKFFLYTLLGSVLMLLAILAIYWQIRHDRRRGRAQPAHFPAGLQRWLWLAFMASFAVKVPMWPVHTWLPDAHVEAPTAGSVILAGVLLKMGGYGFVRFSLPMFPLASQYFTPLIFALSAIAVIYTSFVALAQTDMKKLIAYSSIAHMGFVTMGIFAVTSEAVQGAVIQMLSHGLVSAALFLCVGVALRPAAHARDRPLRRPGRAHAGLCVCLHGLHAGLGRAARHQRLCRRVPDPARHLPGRRRSNASSPRRRCSLAPAYMLYLYRRVIFGTITRADLRDILDLCRARKRLRPADRAGAVDGDLSDFVPRPIRPRSTTIVEQVTPRPMPPACAARAFLLGVADALISPFPICRRRLPEMALAGLAMVLLVSAPSAASARPGSSRGWRCGA